MFSKLDQTKVLGNNCNKKIKNLKKKKVKNKGKNEIPGNMQLSSALAKNWVLSLHIVNAIMKQIRHQQFKI